MIYTRVIDWDDIEAPAFSTISYHSATDNIYVSKILILCNGSHPTTLVVHDEGHACALKIEQKCFIFNSGENLPLLPGKENFNSNFHSQGMKFEIRFWRKSPPWEREFEIRFSFPGKEILTAIR